MKNSSKILAFTAALALFAVQAASAKPKKVIHIGSASGGSTRSFQGGIAVAKELGFFEEEFAKFGYTVEYLTFENGVAVNEAIFANELEFAYIGDVPALTGYANNIGSVWIGEDLVSNTLGAVVKKGSSKKSPSDFIGKTVAVNIGTNAHFLYAKYFEEAGISDTQFSTANLSLANAAQAVITGNADIAFGSIFTLYKLAQGGELDIIFTTKEKPEWDSQFLLLGNKKFLKKNPQLGVAFSKAIIRARFEAKKNPEKFYGVVSGGTLGPYPDYAKEQFNKDGTFSTLHPVVTEEEIKRAQNVYDYFKSIGRIYTEKDVHGFVDNTYILKAYQELGLTP